MLEPVTLGQGRTNCPGLVADERGVVMGQHLALLFSDIARAVGFLRSYSREVTLDDVQATLRIHESQGEIGGREIVVTFAVAGSYAADRAAQAARMHRARVFTGGERHFVPYRDRRSPLGYDLSAVDDVVADATGMVLYSDVGSDKRTLGREIALKNLILGLSPRRLTEAERATERHEVLVVRAEQGLAGQVARYLWQRQIPAKVRTGSTARQSMFKRGGREMQLFRTEGMPRHVAQLLHQTPGLTVYIPVLPNVFVAWGFRHPIALESCAAIFEEDEGILFGAGKVAERIAISAHEVDIRDLIDMSIHGPEGILPPPALADGIRIEALDVELRLARMPSTSAATQALLIPLDRLSWFTRLLYILPAATLRAYDAVIAEPYIIVINRRGVQAIPFGEPMTELYPQIFVPVGMQLLPRVDYDLLKEHLQIETEKNIYFFTETGVSHAVAQSAFKPLSRAMIATERAQEVVQELEGRTAVEEIGTSSVRHSAQSVFSLWRGVRSASDDAPPTIGPPVRPKPKALPQKSADVDSPPTGDV